MQCIAVPLQINLRVVSESWKFRWLIGLPATTIKQHATESKGEPKFVIPISAL